MYINSDFMNKNRQKQMKTACLSLELQ